MDLFVVGRWFDENESGQIWELEGVYDSEQRALDEITDEFQFIGPVTLNERLPDESQIWPGAYYPLGESQQ